MVTISFACGETQFEVPCGTEKDQKPPKCRKAGHITPLCRHRSTCKPHKWHYGACALCRLICEEEYLCDHKCKLRCHGPRPPPNPEFTLKPKKKKSNHQIEVTPGSPCPELVWRPCLSQHIGAERRERVPACPHPCPLPCHSAECPPCKVLIKRSCHCGTMVHVFECFYYNTLSEKEQMTVRSCGGPCHRKLPYCTHLCPQMCHPGQCPLPEKCCKKVTVRCGCQTLKEWLCQDGQAAYHNIGCDPNDICKNQFGLCLLACNSDCKSKIQVVDSVLQSCKPKVEEKEPATEKHVVKRRKRRERVQEVNQASRLQRIVTTVKRLLLFVILLLAVLAALYYGYNSLLKLSDWMNEVEE